MYKYEDVERVLNSLTTFPIDVIELDTDYSKRFGEGFCIDIYFNDMFAWGTSDGALFIPQDHKVLETVVREFRRWWSEYGENFRVRFDAVPRPADDLNENDLDRYFAANRVIGSEFKRSMYEFCGRTFEELDDEDFKI